MAYQPENQKTAPRCIRVSLRCERPSGTSRTIRQKPGTARASCTSAPAQPATAFTFSQVAI